MVHRYLSALILNRISHEYRAYAYAYAASQIDSIELVSQHYRDWDNEAFKQFVSLYLHLHQFRYFQGTAYIKEGASFSMGQRLLH